MQSPEKIKQIVREKYGEIASKSSGAKKDSCCSSDCSEGDYTVMSEDYSQLDGYSADADLGLGCGVPTELANIKKGDTVLDLGSGAGNDVFVVRAIVGETGKVIGVDMTEEMNAKASNNLAKLGYQNVEFRLGEIEKLPLGKNEMDVVISNCVLNLVPSKEKAFSEIYQTLKPGGHFGISDIVTVGELPSGLKKSAEMYAGCVAGALQKDEYLRIIHETGFENVAVKKERKIDLDDAMLAEFLTDTEMEQYRSSNVGIFSVTVYGVKPITN